jgi:RNA polymerase sigma-B factor
MPTPTAPAIPSHETHPPARSLAPGVPTKEELAALYARSRNLRLREQVILQYRELVEILAARMTRRGVSVDDLVQVGTIGLIQALDRYDPDRGVKFATYATNTIIGEIKHYFRDCTWAIKVPRQLQEAASRLRRAAEELSGELNRPPTVPELAQRLDLTEETIVEAMELEVAYVPYSLDAHLGIEDAECHERLAEVLGVVDPKLDRILDCEMLSQAIASLEPRKQWILRRRYFDEWSQSEIGRVLGISQMHVSRLERQALRELHRRIQTDG